MIKEHYKYLEMNVFVVGWLWNWWDIYKNVSIVKNNKKMSSNTLDVTVETHWSNI